MKWMKERDLLIAQTMAFVQSVTGKAPETIKPPEAAKAPEASMPLEVSKTPEADNPVAASAAPRTLILETSETLEPARPAVLTPAEIALALPRTAPPVVMPVPAEVQPIAVKAPVVEARVAAPRQIPNSVAFPRLDLREDFQSEIRARVASFRAHQERFSREREAYCAATMAKVHAVLKDGDLPPLPQSGK